MDQNRFDAITKVFGDRSLSRRRALATGGAALAAGVLASGAKPSLAQDATPEPAAESTGGPTMMFVQSFQRGSVATTEGQEDRYTVTLEQGSGQTIYFSDRPDRIVGASPTPQFLEGLGFPEDNPPNAALVVETAPGETDIAVVELFNPVVDPGSAGVTYEVEVLANWQQSLAMDFAEAPTDLAEMTPAFGSAHLFIDGCRQQQIFCQANRQYVGTLGFQDHCYWWSRVQCLPCGPDDAQDYSGLDSYWISRCNEAFPECEGKCDWYRP